ncbi:DNA repair RAD52-like protein 2, chloroplastic [Nymphaea colorata]|nr:DNA repair RAD52-like protein 2, chloroplastic [Nymphaea colorata]
MEAVGVATGVLSVRVVQNKESRGCRNSEKGCRPPSYAVSVKALSRRRSGVSAGSGGLWISAAADASSKGGVKKGSVPNSNYVVPLDNPSNLSCITRPLVEILRDLNKRVPDKIIKTDALNGHNYIPWYHANRMLSFFAPGWCGEIRNILFSDDGNVTVVYRLTIRGSDGEAFRESCGTASTNGQVEDAVAEAEALAFCRACARFGLGLHLYHGDESL